MSLTITDTEMTSDQVSTRAEFRQHAAADGGGAWIVTGWTGRLLTRNQAISAMTIEEEKASSAPNQALIDSLESELH